MLIKQNYIHKIKDSKRFSDWEQGILLLGTRLKAKTNLSLTSCFLFFFTIILSKFYLFFYIFVFILHIYLLFLWILSIFLADLLSNLCLSPYC